ncbi:MAG TPA: hypothetical protein VFT58_05950, partial [Nitrososphaera sp.]|nr:hypothetical protein [Nitrososphaera sp.]
MPKPTPELTQTPGQPAVPEADLPFDPAAPVVGPEAVQNPEIPTVLAAAELGAAALTTEGVAEQGRFRQVYSTAKEILANKDVRAGAKATVRTVINLGITAADFFPGIGEAASWAADAGKFVGLDLTPNVPKWLAVGSELLEFPTAGLAPSHAIETGMQLWHDRKVIRAGWLAL